MPWPWLSGCRGPATGFGPRVACGVVLSWESPRGALFSPTPTGLPLQALVLLQLWANLDVLLVASWQELSQHVCAFTKALAQHPFKCVAPTPARRVTGTLGGVVPPSLCGAEG